MGEHLDAAAVRATVEAAHRPFRHDDHAANREAVEARRRIDAHGDEWLLDLCDAVDALRAAAMRTDPVAAMWAWDWFDQSPHGETYGVRCGDEVICYTNRTKKGYEDAVRIVTLHNEEIGQT